MGRRPGHPLSGSAAGGLAQAWEESPPLTAAGLAVLGAGAACLGWGAARAVRSREVTPYKAPQYFLTYREGFVRRALPGAVLSRLTGGPPSLRAVGTTGAALSVAAAGAVAPLAWWTAAHAEDGLRAVLAGGTVLSSPLTVSLLLQDVGRYDAVGVLALVGLAAPGWASAPLAGAVAATGLLAAAAGTQEFLLGPLAPLGAQRALEAASALGLDPARTALLVAAVVAPAAALTAASAVASPPDAAVQVARREARRAGVAPPDEQGDALSAVERDVVENLRFFRLFSPGAVVRAQLLWGGAYALSVGVLGELLDRRVSRRYWRSVAYQTAVAAGLSVLGADFRRWWGLGLLGTLGTVAAGRPPARPLVWRAGGGRTGRAAAGAVGLAALNLLVRDRHVYPERKRRT